MLAEKSIFFIVILGLFCFFFSPSLSAQFSAGPQNSNTTAIHKNDTSFSFWANHAEIHRGWQNIADTTLGRTSVGAPINATGKASNTIISLGDSGQAILTFKYAIQNVNGYDFAVFENGFSQNGTTENEYFLELAFVEVSENGIDFIAFESTSNTINSNQVESFDLLNCTKINNLAGKYPLNYGTPFDMEELGLDSIVSIRITDVIGTIDTNFASYDSQGQIINDPYPTAFGSGGFDLNAVGALNQALIDSSQIDTTTTQIHNLEIYEIEIYPNPIQQNSSFNIISNQKQNHLTIYDLRGNKMFETVFNKSINVLTNNISKGVYFIKINNQSRKIIIY